MHASTTLNRCTELSTIMRTNRPHNQVLSDLRADKPGDRFMRRLSSAPVATLGIVSDFFASPQSHPLGHGTVLLGLLGQHPLYKISLVGSHCRC